MTTRQKIIKSHIKHDDYFATIATAIEMLEKREELIIKQAIKNNKILKQLRSDFLFLQKNFNLIKK